uniref:Kinase n=1 Tax=Heterorhabditis bacteriophora TaxID=37862 RepID=A0A1I7X7Q5_HETBA
MDKLDPIPPTFKPRRFHWYIRRKDLDELDHTYDQSMEPSTSHGSKASIQPTLKSGRSDSMADYRFCGGGVSAKYLTNMIIIALIQEITIGK